MAKNFDISDVLSITNGALVSTRHIEGVYDILNFMTGESLFTHALPRAADVCRPALLAQFPSLAEDSLAEVGPHNYKAWLAEMRVKHGDVFAVKPLEADRYVPMHPLSEPILDGKNVIKVVIKCARCGHPQDWHRHDDEKCSSTHPQPCTPDTAPFRCIGYDCETTGYPGATPTMRCGCLDFVKIQE